MNPIKLKGSVPRFLRRAALRSRLGQIGARGGQTEHRPPVAVRLLDTDEPFRRIGSCDAITVFPSGWIELCLALTEPEGRNRLHGEQLRRDRHRESHHSMKECVNREESLTPLGQTFLSVVGQDGQECPSYRASHWARFNLQVEARAL